jgi:hypothetical protein
MRKLDFFCCSSAMRILIPFSHCIRIFRTFFTFFSQFFALLTTFWCSNCETWSKNCKNSKKVRKMRCESGVMLCDGLGQKCECKCEKLFALPSLHGPISCVLFRIWDLWWKLLIQIVIKIKSWIWVPCEPQLWTLVSQVVVKEPVCKVWAPILESWIC